MVRTFNYQRPSKKANAPPPQSLVDFLSSSFKYFDKEKWIDTISNKHWVSVNGVIVTDPNFILPPKCTIGFDVPEELEPEVDEKMELLYLDEHIAVVCKSGNLPVSEGGKYSKRTLVNLAAKIFLPQQQQQQQDNNNNSISSRFLPVHRLDKETSGIVVMARTHEAAVNLGKQFSRCAEDQQQTSIAATEGGASERITTRRNRTNSSSNDNDDDEDNGETEQEQQQQPVSVSKEYIAVLVGNLTETQDIQLRIGDEVEWVKLQQQHDHPSNTEEATAADNHTNKNNKSIKPRALTKFRMICAPKEMTQFGKEARTVVIPIKSGTTATTAILSKQQKENDDDTNKDDDEEVKPENISFTLCRIKLYTGRTHQIRIHCASIGFPLLGDKLYVSGGGSVDCETYLRRAKGQEQVVQQISKNLSMVCSRHLLHAAKLTFTHPVGKTGKIMVFESNPKQCFLDACPELAKFNLF